MKSHEYADALDTFSAYLRGKPEFDTGNAKVYLWGSFYGKEAKEQFLTAVKAVGSGKKEFTNEYIYFFPDIDDRILLRFEAPRNLLCRKIKEAEYECDPLLSDNELASL